VVATEDVRALVTALYEAFNKGDPRAWTENLAEDVLGVGSDPDEWWEGSAVVARVGKAQVEQMHAAGVRFEGEEARVFIQGDVAWVVDRPTISLEDGTSSQMRLTIVLTQRGNELKIHHFHLSAGARNEDVIGEELPTS
jgi:ketosteroid isomerase-like protein